jgi:hypothetical protein
VAALAGFGLVLAAGWLLQVAGARARRPGRVADRHHGLRAVRRHLVPGDRRARRLGAGPAALAPGPVERLAPGRRRGARGDATDDTFGTATSNGCIRVPPDALRALTGVPIGTLVLIDEA